MAESSVHVVQLAEAVTPPPDGVISRTIHQDERLKAVVFGFGAGQELSEHSTPRPAVIHFLSGEARVTLGDYDFVAGPGAWAHLPPGLPHSIAALAPTVMLLLLLK